MDKQSIYQGIEPVFRELFDSYDGLINDSLSASDVEQWDSLGNVQLIVMVEQLFSVRFSSEEVSGLPNLGSLVELVLLKAS